MKKKSKQVKAKGIIVDAPEMTGRVPPPNETFMDYMKRVEAMNVPENTFQMTKKEAGEVMDNISDVLCWMNGFKCGNGSGGERIDIGLDVLRTLNIRIKAWLNKQENR